MAEVFQSGAAAEKFGQMVHALGGPPDMLEDYRTHLPKAPVVRELAPRSAGFVAAIDTRAVGFTVVELGGGRTKTTDPINPAVGLDWLAGLGRKVGPRDADRPYPCRQRGGRGPGGGAADLGLSDRATSRGTRDR